MAAVVVVVDDEQWTSPATSLQGWGNDVFPADAAVRIVYQFLRQVMRHSVLFESMYYSSYWL